MQGRKIWFLTFPLVDKASRDWYLFLPQSIPQFVLKTYRDTSKLGHIIFNSVVRRRLTPNLYVLFWLHWKHLQFYTHHWILRILPEILFFAWFGYEVSSEFAAVSPYHQVLQSWLPLLTKRSIILTINDTLDQLVFLPNS